METEFGLNNEHDIPAQTAMRIKSSEKRKRDSWLTNKLLLRAALLLPAAAS
jgi:hypothetical protein